MNLTPEALMAAVGGSLAVAGVLVAVVGLVGTTAPPVARPTGPIERWLRAGDGQDGAGPLSVWADRRLLVSGAAGAGLLVWLLTSWPLGGLLTAAAIVGMPWILQPGRGSKQQIQRLEALEEWVRRLADIHTAGMSLEQAVASSVRSAPALIAPQIGRLTARLASGWQARLAYRAFADEMNDASVDSVAALMIMHAADRGAGLSAALRELAGQLSEEVLMRRKVEADREKPRTNFRWVSLFCMAAFALSMLSGAYVQPYNTITGQLVLLALAAAFVAVLVWMRRMALTPPAPRFLAPADHDPREPS
ncbi:type II secretion system F family protein [Kitasatospora kifunensis]|uniref:Flp pilus assembly protein TadB n=1 Tax=Kitasatospora kifunensis TaxID=58351 RepID=A0A7W7RAB6_KITKI|nr:type II secretion system F family protein [Kitasatospora kifunensis]MBB4928269.1 Flp pilus assembly protein TadB [Kitasatospora kifunensis]